MLRKEPCCNENTTNADDRQALVYRRFSVVEDSLDPRVTVFQSLQSSSTRFSASGEIVIEGTKAVKQLLRSRLKIKCLFLEEKYLPELYSALEEIDLSEVECLLASRQVMSRVVGFRLHQGLLAIAEKPQPVELEEIEFPAVALNGIVDAENVGAIIRTAWAFGFRSFIVDRDTADPYLRRAIRVSVGTALFSSVCYVESLCVSLQAVKDRAEVICLESDGRESLARESKFPRQLVVVLGSEGYGISPDILAIADRIMKIEMDQSAVSSLNVNAAAAVALSRIVF